MDFLLRGVPIIRRKMASVLMDKDLHPSCEEIFLQIVSCIKKRLQIAIATVEKEHHNLGWFGSWLRIGQGWQWPLFQQEVPMVKTVKRRCKNTSPWSYQRFHQWLFPRFLVQKLLRNVIRLSSAGKREVPPHLATCEEKAHLFHLK